MRRYHPNSVPAAILAALAGGVIVIASMQAALMLAGYDFFGIGSWFSLSVGAGNPDAPEEPSDGFGAGNPDGRGEPVSATGVFATTTIEQRLDDQCSITGDGAEMPRVGITFGASPVHLEGVDLSFTGTSRTGDFQEALEAAIRIAIANFTGGGWDRLLEWKVISVEGTIGGIAGFNILKVTIGVRMV